MESYHATENDVVPKEVLLPWQGYTRDRAKSGGTRLKVLHIAGGFAHHSLYRQLVGHLRDYCDSQVIFSAVRSAGEMLNQPEDEPGLVEYKYRRVLKPLHRIFFRTKVRSVFDELLRATDPSSIDVVHAHTLYSDGAVALRVKRKCNVPFVVAVRNTDLNAFMRLRPDLLPLAQTVLREASQVVFISPAYRANLLSRLKGTLRAEIEKKSVVVPNGLSSYWLESCTCSGRRVSKDTPLRLLYVGAFTRNKNVRGIIGATAEIATRIPVQLTLVGGGADETYIRRCIESRKFPFLKCVGRVDDEQLLRSIYQEHDIFVMPSFTETFGVVYLEALSQGLPVVHSHGQGIDGFFAPGTVCEAVSPSSIRDIAKGVETLVARLDAVRSACVAEAKNFSWSFIAHTYHELYRAAALGEY